MNIYCYHDPTSRQYRSVSPLRCLQGRSEAGTFLIPDTTSNKLLSALPSTNPYSSSRKCILWWGCPDLSSGFWRILGYSKRNIFPIIESWCSCKCFSLLYPCWQAAEGRYQTTILQLKICNIMIFRNPRLEAQLKYQACYSTKLFPFH